jgi:hypothetical protein
MKEVLNKKKYCDKKHQQVGGWRYARRKENGEN